MGSAALVCLWAKRLFSSDSAGGASALASAAVDAGICVDDSHATVNLHCANGASALASAAADACVTNLVCHSRTLLSTRALRTIGSGTNPPEVRSCTAAASLSQETPSNRRLFLVPIVAKTGRKCKPNRCSTKVKTAILAECTNLSVHFRGVSSALFGQNHKNWRWCTNLSFLGDYSSVSGWASALATTGAGSRMPE